MANPPSAAPAHPIAYVRACEVYRAGRLRDALQACISHLSATPSPYPPTLALLGRVLFDSGHPREAATEFERAIALDGRDAWAQVYLARAYAALERPDAARVTVTKARATSPLDAELNVVSASVLLATGDVEGAIDSARYATQLEPALTAGWFNLALALQAGGRLADARDAADRARMLDASDPAASGLAAELAAENGDIAGAGELLATALKRHPDHVALWMESGWLAMRGGDLARAATAYERVLVLRPDDGAALSQLVFCRKQLLDWPGLLPLQQRVREGVAKGMPLVTPFSFLSDPSTRAEQRRCAQTWVDGVAASVRTSRRPAPPPAAAANDRSRRLRIGYLSGDFYQHPTSVLLAGVLEHHDRRGYEIFGYSTGPDDASPMRARVAAAFEHFTPIEDRDPARIAARIASDELDILVDLKGYTEGAPTAALALRPAPVQAHWIGYPGTLGAGFIDYLFVDKTVAPAEHQPDYAESLVWLPDTYQPNDRSRAAAASASRASLGLPASGVVLASFNAGWKLNPGVFDAWARVLAAVPDSVLWLLARDAADPLTTSARREMAARGVARERIVFATHRAHADYLALYAHADLFLDTWPYNAHTTASDALWMGCPVVTWLGDTFAGRVGASLLRAAGMDALVAPDVEGYVKLAIALASDRERRNALHARLADARTQSPLYDAAAMARHAEYAYTRMAQQQRSGHRESFEVPRH